MDKLMDNPWFMKGVAFLLAFLLFSSVSDGKKDRASDENVPSSQNSETIEDVPVNRHFDTENLVVSGVPETVDVTIKGPKSIVQSTKSLKDFEVYVDLSDAKIGKQKVKIKIRDLSDKLDVKISPSSANVLVQEKVVQEFKVEAEYNSDLLEEGYIAEQPIIEPNKVKITGAKGDIEKISYVKATVDLTGPIQETITKQATILVLDQNLNKLNVKVEPETVAVTIPIKNSSKTVPINIIQKGNPQSGIIIDEITLDKKEAKIIGKEETIKSIESVRAEVDVSKITENTTINIPIIVPDGITKVTPEVVKATIKVTKEEHKEISSIPIKIEGLNTQFELIFRDPSDGKTSLTITGASEAIKPLTVADFKIFINVANLTEGDHDIPILTSGPNKVSWKLEKTTARISIIKKDE